MAEKFKLIRGPRRITLSGTLDDTSQVQEMLNEYAIELDERRSPLTKLVVEAKDCNVTGAGYELWLNLLEHLDNTHLRYERSQLALLVEFDSEYPHKNTEIADSLAESDTRRSRDGI